MQKQFDLIFLGDSLTAFHDWSDFGRHHNAGIAGDTTDGLLYRLHYTLEKKPKTVVVMIGVNDLLQGQKIEKMKENYTKLFTKIKTIPNVVILSLLPIYTSEQTAMINENIIRLNHFLKSECTKQGFLFIDLYTLMCDDVGGLKGDLTSDGVHLTANGYGIWQRALTAHLPAF